VLHEVNVAPRKIATARPAFFYVLLSFLALDRVVDVPVTESFMARARDAGKELYPLLAPSAEQGW
jgi:hypothetical protein